MSEQHPYQGVRVYGLGFKPYNIRTRGYRVTCLSTVLSICSSALRAVRWMSPLSAPIATLKTARMACVSGNQSSFRGHKQRAHLHAALDCLAVGAALKTIRTTSFIAEQWMSLQSQTAKSTGTCTRQSP